MRILVVDDEPAVREAVERALKLEVCPVEQVATARGGTVSVNDSSTGGALFRLELPD